MFSVIIPLYNKAAYIERCLNSVFNQTYGHYEVIVVNDGSTDASATIVSQNYKEKVKFISQINQGVSAARNRGISAAQYPFIAFLDADDCWHEKYLETIAAIIEQEEPQNVKIIGSHYTSNYSKLSPLNFTPDYYKISEYFKVAIRNTLFSSSSTVVNADFFQYNEGFNTSLISGEDIDLWLRTVSSGGNSYYVTSTLVYYSDEDMKQATRTQPNVDLTLVGEINTLYEPLLDRLNNPEFSKFVSKYVYFNLYPYYFDSNNHKKAKESLKRNKYRYFLLDLVYCIPLPIGKRLVKSKRYNRYMRLYLKFVLRKILK